MSQITEFSMINFNHIALLSRVARSPYIAKKYGHLLDGNEFYDEIKTYKVNLKLTIFIIICNMSVTMQAPLDCSLTRNEPTNFSYRRRQFVKYARNEKDMNICRNSSTQLLNFKVGVCLIRRDF